VTYLILKMSHYILKNHFMAQKTNQPTFRMKVQSYINKKDKDSKMLLVYYPWLCFMILQDKECQNKKGTIFAHCKHTFSLEIWKLFCTLLSIERQVIALCHNSKVHLLYTTNLQLGRDEDARRVILYSQEQRICLPACHSLILPE
jgi:hypothetical protein